MFGSLFINATVFPFLNFNFILLALTYQKYMTSGNTCHLLTPSAGEKRKKNDIGWTLSGQVRCRWSLFQGLAFLYSAFWFTPVGLMQELEHVLHLWTFGKPAAVDEWNSGTNSMGFHSSLHHWVVWCVLIEWMNERKKSETQTGRMKIKSTVNINPVYRSEIRVDSW